MSSSAESLTTATPPTKKRRVDSSETEEKDHSTNGTSNGVSKVSKISVEILAILNRMGLNYVHRNVWFANHSSKLNAKYFRKLIRSVKSAAILRTF